MLLASAPYRPRGYVLDFFVLSGSPTSQTFDLGATYYVSGGFGINGIATFKPGCTIKYTNNAYISLTAAPSFPDTLQTPVFTSVRDDGFGEKIPGGTGSPNWHSSPALWMYWIPSGTTVKNARFRWFSTGIKYNSFSGGYNHTVTNGIFENGGTSISFDVPNGWLILYNTKKRNASTYSIVSGACADTMPDLKFYTDKSFAGTKMEEAAAIKVPDTMGAVGPNHYVEMIMDRVRIYSKSTGLLISGQDIGLAEFFGVTLPQGVATMIDPDITYDP
jgi:hypothetical protein